MPYEVRTPSFRGARGWAVQDAHTRRVITKRSCDDDSSESDDIPGSCQVPEVRREQEAQEPQASVVMREEEEARRKEMEEERRKKEEERRAEEASREERLQREAEERSRAERQRQQEEEEERRREEQRKREEEEDERRVAEWRQKEEERRRAAEIEEEEARVAREEKAEEAGSDCVCTRMTCTTDSTTSEEPRTGMKKVGDAVDAPQRLGSRNGSRATGYSHVKSRLHHMTAACKAKIVSNIPFTRRASSSGEDESKEPVTPPRVSKQLNPASIGIELSGTGQQLQVRYGRLDTHRRPSTTENSPRPPCQYRLSQSETNEPPTSLRTKKQHQFDIRLPPSPPVFPPLVSKVIQKKDVQEMPAFGHFTADNLLGRLDSEWLLRQTRGMTPFGGQRR